MLRLRPAVVPALGIAALVAVVLLAGGQGRPMTAFERVAANPARYSDAVVQVTGTVQSRPPRDPTGFPGAFVIAGPEGRRMLVVPALHGRLPHETIGLRVSVRGTVIPLAPTLESRGDDAPTVARQVRARAILQAASVAPRPE